MPLLDPPSLFSFVGSGAVGQFRKPLVGYCAQCRVGFSWRARAKKSAPHHCEIECFLQ